MSQADSRSIATEILLNGFAFVPLRLENAKIQMLRLELESAIAQENSWHRNPDRSDADMVLVCPMYSVAIAELLAEKVLDNVITELLDESAIVYAFTSSSMAPRGQNFSGRIHNDSPHNYGTTLMNVGVTLPLTDFTTDNGATWLLPRSHRSQEQPTQSVFEKGAQRFVAPAGTALIFDARLWHRGGQNSTEEWRHALTINFARGWMKQRIDLPRLLGSGFEQLVTAKTAQRLGYRTQVPASLYEYYQPEHRRLHRGI